MKYYLIVGEASGDLHASRLMRSLKKIDEFAEFRFFGGDLMAAEGLYGLCACTATFGYHLFEHEEMQGRYCEMEAGCSDTGRLSGI